MLGRGKPCGFLCDCGCTQDGWYGRGQGSPGELYGEVALLILATSNDVIDALEDTELVLALFSLFSSAMIESWIDSII